MRRHHHAAFPADALARGRSCTVSVVVPARNEAASIGPIAAVLAGLRDRGVVDELLVLDDSVDGTGAVAAAAGADVVAQRDVLPELGPVLGKGDALYRGLAASHGEVVVFVDGDTADFGEHFVCGLLGPVLLGDAQFVKGTFQRPWLEAGGAVRPAGGGRVTELCARPLLARWAPELAAFGQPLSGEVAGTRALLERLPFTCGYGVDVGLLIDAWRTAGPAALAEVDLGTRQNRHQPLAALGPMAEAVLDAVVGRLAPDGLASRAQVRAPLTSRRAVVA